MDETLQDSEQIERICQAFNQRSNKRGVLGRCKRRQLWYKCLPRFALVPKLPFNTFAPLWQLVVSRTLLSQLTVQSNHCIEVRYLFQPIPGLVAKVPFYQRDTISMDPMGSFSDYCRYTYSLRFVLAAGTRKLDPVTHWATKNVGSNYLR